MEVSQTFAWKLHELITSLWTKKTIFTGFRWAKASLQSNVRRPNLTPIKPVLQTTVLTLFKTQKRLPKLMYGGAFNVQLFLSRHLVGRGKLQLIWWSVSTYVSCTNRGNNCHPLWADRNTKKEVPQQASGKIQWPLFDKLFPLSTGISLIHLC